MRAAKALTQVNWQSLAAYWFYPVGASTSNCVVIVSFACGYITTKNEFKKLVSVYFVD